MSFNVKSEILSAIAKTNDENMKMLLLLMLGVLEEIGSKVDAVINNEKALQSSVLNGHAPVHHEHHEWLTKRISIDAKLNKIIDWCEASMKTEEELKVSGKRALFNVFEKVVFSICIAAIGAFFGFSLK